MTRRNLYWIAIVSLVCAGLVLPVAAQQSQPEARVVSDDEVNAIATKLYCPVCENIPLDTCGTAACADWREEIRTMLVSGMNEEEIIDDFVRRFGDRVVGTPQDPVLRALSLITPWLVTVMGLAAGTYFFLRRTNPAPASPAASEGSSYHDLLERDLKG